MEELTTRSIEELLEAVGDHLALAGVSVSVVAVGGASLIMLGWVERATRDVDIIALAEKHDQGYRLMPPDPFPPALAAAIARVARDFSLPADWMKAAIGAQWAYGLPAPIDTDIQWRRYKALEVGFAGRKTLIALKLFASVDQGPESVHVQDLIALRPADDELHEAARWVQGQDENPAFPNLVAQVVAHVQRYR
jgi:hypothetical protein